MSAMSTHPGSIDAAIPAASWFWAGVIRIDDALGCAARCRHVALCQRGIGAFEVIVLPALVDLQADRVVRIIGLGSSRRRCRSHPNCQIVKARMRIRLSLSVPCPSTGHSITTGPTTIAHIGFRYGFRSRPPISRPATAGVSWRRRYCGRRRVALRRLGPVARNAFFTWCGRWDSNPHDVAIEGF
jgi:hypothetical protein